MIQVLEQRRYAPDEYLELEAESEERHEYIDGVIVEMAGGTPNHNKIALNLSSILNFGLKRQPFEVYVTDQRLWISRPNLYTYPDVMVMAQPIEFAPNRRDTLVNPIFIAEVLSDSTKAYDRDQKFAAYRTISSLQDYVLIDQYFIHVEHYAKTGTRSWQFSDYGPENQTIQFSSHPMAVELLDLYDKVNFEDA